MKYTVDSPEVLRDHAEVTNGHAYKNAGGRFIGKEMMTREEELQYIAEQWNKSTERDLKARIKNAANDLLDALEGVAEWDDVCNELHDELRSRINAVIAKARGK
jgi:hypothetical protein